MSALTVTPYNRRYLQAIRDLMFISALVHVHLDWYDTDSWLESRESHTYLAWHKGRLVGFMANSRPLNGASWLRVVALHERTDQTAVICALWQAMLEGLRPLGVRTVAALVVRDWLTPHLQTLGFHYNEEIITLSRYGHELPEQHPRGPVVRVAETRDLPSLVQVDHTAFIAPWQLAEEELQQAHRMCSSCTIALYDNLVVGYQLSTLYFDGAHLARLAVVPHAQGHGVGSALLADVLTRFFRRGIYAMTLNTQSSNQQSQQLYARFGFRPNGYNLPYWSIDI